MTRGSALARLPKEYRRELYLFLVMSVGNCPQCGVDAGGAVIYRSSIRSVTMRCRDCGLQWTMTVHTLARAARRWAEKAKGKPHEGAVALIAQRFTEWAEGVDERRGRPLSA